ncbi:MAG: hypothetical protein WC655_29350 [Candidatus Hydrogenedentales bacterium]|jgi:hypothetical protein
MNRHISPLSLAFLFSALFAAAAAQPATTDFKGDAEAVPLSRDHALIYTDTQNNSSDEPIVLNPGPHLFIDRYLISESANVRRVVNSPQRDTAIPNPIITGKEDHCYQPYMTILRDDSSGRFRMWYGGYVGEGDSYRSCISYIESADGIRWDRPARVLDDPAPIQFGTCVVDDGPSAPLPAERFKYAWWKDGGLKIATSPDGLAWKPMTDAPVLKANHDITGLFFDPLRKRYVATVSVYRPGDTWAEQRRVTMHSFSTGLRSWTTPHHVVLPYPSVEPGIVQFYAMDGYLVRGDLLIGMVKILRDDLKADNPPDPPDAYGMGYTALAWSRDGETWTRDTTHFFDPDPRQGAWDHAHAWIDEQVAVGDDVYLYYGGYARGHKVNRYEERQVGLVKIPRDRYVAWEAGSEPGRIVTPLLTLNGEALSLNAGADGGSIAVQMLDEDSNPIAGFAFADNTPITTDALDAPLAWKRALTELDGKSLRLEFALTNARLFAVNLK